MSPDLRKRRSTHTPHPANTAHTFKQKPHLLNWDHLPDWRKDNEYIRTGYRPLSNSYLTSFWSCFHLHNETGNIYSHLLAMMWMLVLPLFLYPYAKIHYPSAGLDDWIIFGGFFLGGGVCFGLSTVYHVCANHSRGVHDVWHRLDLLGEVDLWLETVSKMVFRLSVKGRLWLFPISKCAVDQGLC